MNNTHNEKLRPNAQSLRKNMTQEERHLWYDFLKDLPLTVHRQKVIGKYIVDFYVASAQTVIELDGSQHYEPGHTQHDFLRDSYLRSLGLTVLRYANSDVNKNFQGVCQDIWEHLGLSETPEPSPRGDTPGWPLLPLRGNSPPGGPR